MFEFNLFSIGVGAPENELYLKGLASKSEFYSKASVSQLKALALARKYVNFLSCPKSCPLDHVCFALDQSRSIQSQDWDKKKIFVTDIAVEISNPNVETTYSAVKFSSSVQPVARTIRLGVFTSQVLSTTQSGGGTNINSGLESCFDRVKSGKGTRSIILLTDGRSFAASIANQIKQAGISLVSIGIGNNVDVIYLKNIASDPDSEFYVPADFAKLDEKVAKVVKTTCKTPTVTSFPDDVIGLASTLAASAPSDAKESSTFCDGGEC
ncbi:unnamed protein product [Agarophyton chilense]